MTLQQDILNLFRNGHYHAFKKRVAETRFDIKSAFDNVDVGMLSQACHRNEYDFARYLLDAGFNPDLRYEADKATILHKVARTGNLRMMNLLLEYGAASNLQDNLKQTPLFFAARHDCYECVRRLVRAGVRENIGDVWLRVARHPHMRDYFLGTPDFAKDRAHAELHGLKTEIDFLRSNPEVAHTMAVKNISGYHIAALYGFFDKIVQYNLTNGTVPASALLENKFAGCSVTDILAENGQLSLLMNERLWAHNPSSFHVFVNGLSSNAAEAYHQDIYNVQNALRLKNRPIRHKQRVSRRRFS